MARLKIFTLGILGIFMMTTGFGCKGIQGCSIKKPPEAQPVTLEYWGVWDSPDQVAPLIGGYHSTHPTININYRQLRYEEYERKLLEAWADDRGPDIMAIPVSWLNRYKDRLTPLPAVMSIPVKEVTGTLKKETITSLQEINGLSIGDIKSKYVDVVYNNVIKDNSIYALPYSVDTLITFYNLDLLEAAGIPQPMNNFSELIDQVPKLTKVSADNKIYQAGVALGGTDNIPRYFDIVSNLMLQTNVEVKGSSFNPNAKAESAANFVRVFGFYTDFTRPGLASYSWDSSMPNALDMFMQGNLAYFFGYSYNADAIRAKGVSFDWGITKFPQPAGAQGDKYYSDYWVNVVPKKSKNVNAAWNFVQTTASTDLVKVYLDANKRPTALRALINEQKANQDLAVSANQVLAADNWYGGYDYNLAEQYFKDFIDGILDGQIDMNNREHTNLFIERINQTYYKQQ